MAEYALYLESGPKRRKTMVHVLDLLGCMATGPTTEDALAATSEAIRAYLRFLHDIGELSKPIGDFTTRVEEHITEGLWLGNGSPYVTFAPTSCLSAKPSWASSSGAFLACANGSQPGLSHRTTTRSMQNPSRAAGLLAVSSCTCSARPEPTCRPFLVPCPVTAAIVTAAQRAELTPAEALRRVGELAAERLRASSEEQRTRAFERGQMQRSLRKGIRRTLEHDWEHLAELSRHPGAPQI
jgi:predicted RNase H-like HicB family nuclease